jgi:predicted O-linked N-acetylglucosamine transferase (SPINDLY family)
MNELTVHSIESLREALERVRDACRAGRLAAAEKMLARAAAAAPDTIEAHAALAESFFAAGNHEQAISCARRVLTIDPRNGAAYAHIGRIMCARGEWRFAKAALRKAVECDPGLFDAHANLGTICRREHRLCAAIEHYQTALSLAPKNARILNNIGLCLTDLGISIEARQRFEHALALAPDIPDIRSNYCYCLCHAALDQEFVAKEHKAWGGRFDTHSRAVRSMRRKDAHAPMRIGYVSPDFRGHSVAYFLEPLLREHRDVAVYCYSNSMVEDQTTARFKALGHVWRSIHRCDDQRAAKMIRGDGIDVLVDCAGHTEGNRLGLFGLRPAPVQVSWCGYPATTGLRSIDFRITDGHVDPPGQEAYHSEDLFRTDPCFLCYMPPHDAPPPVAAPSLHGAPFTFGSCNKLGKISPETLACWAEILRQAPHSRLLLKAASLDEPGAQKRVLEAFSRAGIDSERILCRGYAPSRTSHLAFYGMIDCCLDTFPYAGTTTTCEAFWMGVPVVTLCGDRHVSRTGATLCRAVGLDAYVAESVGDYVHRAVYRAQNPDALQALRAALRDRMRASVLCDAAGFARRIERAYRTMWDIKQKRVGSPRSAHE